MCSSFSSRSPNTALRPPHNKNERKKNPTTIGGWEEVDDVTVFVLLMFIEIKQTLGVTKRRRGSELRREQTKKNKSIGNMGQQWRSVSRIGSSTTLSTHTLQDMEGKICSAICFKNMNPKWREGMRRREE